MESPSPYTPFGIKGVGESGVIGSAAAVANALSDALHEYGVTINQIPITPESIWRAMQGAQPVRTDPAPILEQAIQNAES
jgi:carbon-monoxide dehydrogenase large subunit